MDIAWCCSKMSYNIVHKPFGFPSKPSAVKRLSWHSSLHTHQATLTTIYTTQQLYTLQLPLKSLKPMKPTKFWNFRPTKQQLPTSSHPPSLLVQHHRGLCRSTASAGLPLAPLAHARPACGVLGLLPVLYLL